MFVLLFVKNCILYKNTAKAFNMDVAEDISISEDLVILYEMYNINKIKSGPKELFKSREKFGFYSTGFNILLDKNPELLYKSIRMNKCLFDLLSGLVCPFLIKKSRRKPVEPQHRLYITLYYLAHGCSIYTLSMKFRVGYETARSIILETCEILWEKLRGQYICPPNESDWREIAKKFYNITGLPNCIGALDGKHVRVKLPNFGGSQYFNYKKYNSIVSMLYLHDYDDYYKDPNRVLQPITFLKVLMAVCDAKYCFTLVDVGAYGSTSDGGVFRNSDFGRRFMENQLNVPNDEKLPGTEIYFPHYLVADAAFPLKTNIMKPFAKITNSRMLTYNNILSSARVRIEMAFGILAAKWRILRTEIGFMPENVKKIILATVILHNFVRIHSNEPTDPPQDEHFWQGVSREELSTANSSPQNALNNRITLCNYLNDR